MYTVPVNAPHLNKNIIILITIIVIFIACIAQINILKDDHMHSTIYNTITNKAD